MKKSKIIASVLILSIMLMGAGYAYWTDSAKIKNTVNSGNMNVEFVSTSEKCPPFIPIPVIGNLEIGSNYVRSSINLDDPKTITVTVNNLYPGTGVLYTAKFENKGTIPAVIESVEVKFIDNNELLKNNLIVLGGFVQIRPGKLLPVASGAFPEVTQLLPIKYGPCNLKDLEYNLNKMLKNRRLEPGDYVLFDIPDGDKNNIAAILDAEGIEGYNPKENNCIIMGLPKTKGDQNNLKNQHIQFQIKLNFKQFNA